MYWSAMGKGYLPHHNTHRRRIVRRVARQRGHCFCFYGRTHPCRLQNRFPGDKNTVTNKSSDECTQTYFAMVIGGGTRRHRSGEHQNGESAKSEEERESETRHDTSRG